MSLHGKTIIVTGASSGIGEALSLELLQRGALVVGIGRSQQALAILAKKYGERFIPMVCDVSCSASVEHLFVTLDTMHVSIDIFFLNAGLAGSDAVEMDGFDLDKHVTIMGINYFGVLYFIHYWKIRGGEPTHFVVTSSINVWWASPKGSAYAASKAAISKAFEGFGLYFYDSGTRFSSIYCGPVRTQGLLGSLPFSWSPQKMGKYMADFAEGKQKRKYPSLFYYFLCHLLKWLPHRWVRCMLALRKGV